MEILDINTSDLAESEALRERLLELNNDHQVELSRLNFDELQSLVNEAVFAKRIGQVDALIIAFDQDANYDSPNFLWFKSRYSRFIYVDRVVVSENTRGHGFARRLYLELFDEAVRKGHSRIVCEVNAIPPNPESDVFHERLGFKAVGRQSIHNGSKTVTYMEKAL